MSTDPLDALLAASANDLTSLSQSNALDALLAPVSAEPTVAAPEAQEALESATDAPTPPRNDPFGDIEYTGDLETDTKAELTAAQAAFRDRAKTYKKQRLLVEDSEFWVAVCFRTRADKEDFLRKHGLIHLGDKYLNGYAVAEALKEQ